MGVLLSFLLVVLAGLLAIPVIVFCIEILAAIALPQHELFVGEAPTNSRTGSGS